MRKKPDDDATLDVRTGVGPNAAAVHGRIYRYIKAITTKNPDIGVVVQVVDRTGGWGKTSRLNMSPDEAASSCEGASQMFRELIGYRNVEGR